mmetsp:Transcript_90513/g.290151  ORF Transcript_90513/g.290151 Transcript_90513/m.290151 type:complete len:101 (-) Transcript_90513:129-431(-)
MPSRPGRLCLQVITDLFVGWGRQVEKTTPLSEADLVKYFDDMHVSLTSTGRLDAISARPAVPAGAALIEAAKHAKTSYLFAGPGAGTGMASPAGWLQAER